MVESIERNLMPSHFDESTSLLSGFPLSLLVGACMLTLRLERTMPPPRLERVMPLLFLETSWFYSKGIIIIFVFPFMVSSALRNSFPSQAAPVPYAISTSLVLVGVSHGLDGFKPAISRDGYCRTTFHLGQ